MNAGDFRRLALSLPQAVESAHMDHPDFRVGGKIFATLGYPGAGWAMVKLMPDQQADFVRAQPQAFVAVKGAWGKRGATNVHLKLAAENSLRAALQEAWRNTAPKKIAAQLKSEMEGGDNGMSAAKRKRRKTLINTRPSRRPSGGR
jgi:hypothetical protein